MNKAELKRTIERLEKKYASHIAESKRLLERNEKIDSAFFEGVAIGIKKSIDILKEYL